MRRQQGVGDSGSMLGCKPYAVRALSHLIKILFMWAGALSKILGFFMLGNDISSKNT